MTNTYYFETLGDTTISMLKEVKEICDANDIEYYLAPKILIRAILSNDFDENFTLPEVYMTLDNFLRFIDVIERDRPANRSLDYMMNNKNYPSFNVSYVNENTTYINITRGNDFARHGIKVTINIIRNDIKKKMPAYLETGREENSHRAKSHDNWKTNTVGAFVGKIQGMAGDDFSKRLYKYLLRSYKGNPDSERVFVRTYRRKRVYMDRSTFEKKDSIEIGGYEFTIPENVDDYIAAFYGRDWRNSELPRYRFGNVLISNTVPYTDYLSELMRTGTTIEDVFEQQNIIREENIVNREVVKSKTKVFRVAKRSGDRLSHYEILNNNIDEIRSLRDEHKYDELENIFYDYDQDVKKYLKNDLALCPSEELMEIECELMEHRAEFESANKLRGLTPDLHKKPIA